MFKISDYNMDKAVDYNGKPLYEAKYGKSFRWIGFDDGEEENYKDGVWLGGFCSDDGWPIMDCFLFSFDKDTVYDLYRDYPDNLTEEERKMFREHYPTLAGLRE